MKKIPCSKILFGLVLAILIAAGSAYAEPWKFGIISDTQWTESATPGTDPANQNPNTVPASIIKQVDKQFVNAGVRFVIAMGDQVDIGSQTNDYTRALYAQDLYNAGIGFYPIRGNHEAANGTYATSDLDFLHAYPQISGGLNNATPFDITNALIPAAILVANPPATATGTTFTVGAGFSYPTDANSTNHSVSYSFRYNNATFLMLDQFQSPDYYTSHIIPDQQEWISSTLSGRPINTQAFAFTHKNILGGNHKDNMFGSQIPKFDTSGNPVTTSPLFESTDPGDCYDFVPSGTAAQMAAQQAFINGKQSAENIFLGLLQTNKVKYMISGHDHHHYNSVVTSPDQHKVHQLITASDSSKFYTPGLPVSGHDVPVEQDLARIGYYIFTVDGPRVTIDYYADNHGSWQSDFSYPYGTIDTVNYPLRVTPALTFVKRSTTGYSLNGKENLVAQGAPYAMTDDTTVAATMESGFKGTSMAILAGINGSTVKTNYNKATEKAVNTGWAPKDNDLLDSDILTLWGMTDLGAFKTDPYVLSMTYNPGHSEHLGNGGFGIATKDENGNWVNAVDKVGGSTFVKGPWMASYGLGTYGVDASTKTAWAVIDYDGSFAVANGIEPVPGHRK